MHNDIIFRSSSLGHIMVDAKTKAEGALSDTCKTHLVDVYIANTYNRRSEISTKQFDKGNDTEEDSIHIVSRLMKTFFRKNEEHLSNGFIKGTPDLFVGESIHNAEKIIDIKSSWDVFSFFRAKNKPLNKMYYWQVMAYMWLTGAKYGSVDYCLNNTPFYLIEQEIRKERYNWRDVMPQWAVLQILANHVYDRATFCDYMQKLMIFEFEDEKAEHIYDTFVEIPLKERHFNFEFERDDSKIEAIKARVIECRNWMEANLFKKV